MGAWVDFTILLVPTEHLLLATHLSYLQTVYVKRIETGNSPGSVGRRVNRLRIRLCKPRRFTVIEIAKALANVVP